MRHSIDLFRNYRQSFFDDIPKDPLLQNENVEQVINNFYQIHSDPKSESQNGLQLDEKSSELILEDLNINWFIMKKLFLRYKCIVNKN